MGDEALRRVVEQILGLAPHRVEVAGPQRGDEPPMRFDGPLTPTDIARVEAVRGVSGSAAEKPGQLRTARNAVELPVEGELRIRDSLDVRQPARGRRNRSGQHVIELGQAIQIRLLGQLGGAQGQLHRDSPLQPEDVGDIAGPERRDDVAAIGDRVHHPLAAQRQQRLAHRGDADAQVRSSFIEPDVVAGTKFPGHDRAA